MLSIVRHLFRTEEASDPVVAHQKGRCGANLPAIRGKEA